MKIFNFSAYIFIFKSTLIECIKGGGQKNGFHLGAIMWVSYFGLWAAGPMIFHVGSVGSQCPFNRPQVLHFLANLTHFSRFTPTFTQIFLVLVLLNPSFAVYVLWATLLTLSFCSFIPRATCSPILMELSLTL